MPARTPIHVRTRTMIGALACCCAALAGCATTQANQPATTVKAPNVSKPPAPASAQAALSSEAFTPYAALGLATDDGLAPGESNSALAAPCMNAAGYPGGGDLVAAFGDADGPDSLAYAYPWGAWGYLGTANAQQYGFQYPANSASSTLGLGVPPPDGLNFESLPAGLTNPASLPAAERAAANKCGTIINDFRMDTGNGPTMADIWTIGNDIISDVSRSRAVNAAAKSWLACMAKNGYSSLGRPQNVDTQEQQKMDGNGNGNRPGRTQAPTVSPAANQAQITAAVTDADCTQSSDLAGIYFAVQASYEQQLVSANRQALTADVSQYRTAYAKELKRLPALLRTTKARCYPFPVCQRRRPGSP